jgi:hypothetical protein
MGMPVDLGRWRLFSCKKRLGKKNQEVAYEMVGKSEVF